MQAIFDLLAKCDCPLLVIGGHGIEAHGVSRQTLDVDCLLAVDDRDAFNTALGRGVITSGLATRKILRVILTNRPSCPMSMCCLWTGKLS